MRTIRDAIGDSWDVHLTFGHVLKIRSRTGVSLIPLTQQDQEALTAKLTDIEFVTKVLMVLLEEELRERKVTEQEWLDRRMDLRTFRDACVVISEEISDFFQSSTSPDHNSEGASGQPRLTS